jgi:hypothetical protein
VLTFSTNDAHAQSAFWNLHLGMPAQEVLALTGHSVSELAARPIVSGRRILNDTVAWTACNLPVRRSLAFDTLERLDVIGITYRTRPEHTRELTQCMLGTLEDEYGKQSCDSLGMSVVHRWVVDASTIEFEAKAYNDQDTFLMVYMYGQEPKP